MPRPTRSARSPRTREDLAVAGAERVRTRTGRRPCPLPRLAGARRARAPTAPRTPGRCPSISTTSVPSGITTPRSSATRRRPRASAAGWTVAAPGIKTPSRKTGERTRAADGRGVQRHETVAEAVSANASTASDHAPSCAGAALAVSEPALVYQASIPWSRANEPISSTAASIASPTAPRPVRAVPRHQRRVLVPPVRGKAAVATRRPTATDVRLEQHDPRAWLQLRGVDRAPQAGVAAAHDHDVGRDRAAQRWGGRARCGAATASAASASRSHHDRRPALGRTPPSTLSAAGREQRGIDEIGRHDGFRHEIERGQVVDRFLPVRRARSRRGPWPAGRGPVQTSIVASRIAACTSRCAARSGTALIAASSPTSGLASISSIARSVGRDEPGERRRALAVDRRPSPAISPVPGSGVIVVDGEHVDLGSRSARAGPARCCANPVAASTAPWRRPPHPGRSPGTRRSARRRASGRRSRAAPGA